VRRSITEAHLSQSNNTNVPAQPVYPKPERPPVDRGALRLAGRFAVSAAVVVGIVQAVLFVPFFLGLVSGFAFAITSAVLSSVAIGVLSYRTARVLNNVRDVIARFSSTADDGTSQAAANSNWSDLDASLIQLQERTHQRLAELKSSREAVARQSSANRRIADHLKQAQRISRVGSWEWERKSNRVVCSEEVYRLLHVDREQFKPTTASLIDLVLEDDRRAFRRWIIRLSKGAEPHGIDIRMRVGDGTIVHLHVLGEAFRRLDERTVGVMGTIQDATERTHAIQQIHRLAYYDVLTELPNRSRFHEKLAETLDTARRTGKSFAIMFLDLDQFKRINDTLGHSVGDDLLRIVAQRLTRVLRVDGPARARGKAVERDVCRQGGDEFIVLLNGVGTEEQAARAANRVIETLAQPISIGASEVFVSASIGIVLFPRDGEDLDSLLKNADVAMYHAKAEGRNRHSFYHDSMRQATAQRLSLEHDLRRAIEGEQFELHYQPQIDVLTNRITGMEALIRWNHPTLGMLWPQHFIRVAEEAGLIMAIWEWVFVSSLIQHNAWRQQGLPALTISVNLSSIQFTDMGLAARVKEIASVIGVPMEHIELELTESALVQDFDRALLTLQQLRKLGVKVAIDDFGTGYSSLAYLRKLPFDKIKLDHTFTADAVESEQGAAIARAIIAMAHSLKLKVVAEGVETQQQIDTLSEMGCTTMQGYLLSRPLTVDAMSQLLHRYFGSEPIDLPVEESELPGAVVGPPTALH
jgi:diguanylate cyclase (GGDEF)-like protein/PAS domain S-box-containing protein